MLLFLGTAQGQALDLETSIEAAHFLLDPGVHPERAAAVFSPDKRQFAVRLVRADIGRDGAWLEIYVGKTGKQALPLRPISRLFTRGLERPPVYRKLLQNDNRLFWLDNRRFAFLWEDAAGTAQVVAMDASSGSLTYLTNRPRDVVGFSPGAHGALAFISQRALPAPPPEEPYGGTLITAADAHALLSATPSLGFLEDRFWLDAYVQREGNEPVRLPFDFARRLYFKPEFTSAGDRLAINAMVTHIPEAWQVYRRNGQGLPEEFIEELEERHVFRRPITQTMIVDTARGSFRPLWDRPTLDYDAPLSWSPSDREVLVPSALSDPAATGEVKVALFATVDTASGAELRAEDGACGLRRDTGRMTFAWISDTRVQAQLNDRWFHFNRTPDGWACTTAAKAAAPMMSSRGPEILLRQSLHRPPTLVARGRKGDELLLDPTPELAVVSLGKVESFDPPPTLTARHGWLYYPLGYVKGRRYPLVLQVTTSTAATDQFSLYGMPGGAGVGASDSIYAAQLLSARGIMVLSLPRIRGSEADGSEAGANRLMIEGAIDELDRRGLIDPSRVGLAGWSRPAWLVAYCLTHSSKSFAAALISDATEAGYVMSTVLSGYGEGEVGTAPFGLGLKSWLEQAQGFSAERIRAPLRIHNEMWPGGAGRLIKWELFSRMRQLGLPVEYLEIPDIDHGSHTVKNPRQALFNKASAVDWFTFWLKDEIDPVPAKAEQYRRWQLLRRQHEKVLEKPRPPLLEWTATPISEPSNE